VKLNRDKGQSYGFVLRGSKPTVVDTVEPGSPADLAGIHVNDAILAINDIDVEQKSHKYLVEFLESAGTTPVLDVIQKHEYDLLHWNESFASDIETTELRNGEGKTFKEKVGDFFELLLSFRELILFINLIFLFLKVKEVLNSREKTMLKRALLEYNNKK
jgi:hypothetical protein